MDPTTKGHKLFFIVLSLDHGLFSEVLKCLLFNWYLSMWSQFLHACKECYRLLKQPKEAFKKAYWTFEKKISDHQYFILACFSTHLQNPYSYLFWYLHEILSIGKCFQGISSLMSKEVWEFKDFLSLYQHSLLRRGSLLFQYLHWVHRQVIQKIRKVYWDR